jgi:mannose-6-phosphate isomerase-like protein (cupin superfamily)
MSLVSTAPQSVVYLEGRKDLAVTTQMAYGNDSSIMIATRPSGFHSKPHYHDSEQLNYVVDGEMWIFIGEEGFPLKKGDFFRVPRNALHWSWNRSDKPCTFFESHAPGLPHDPVLKEVATPLFAENEAPRVVGNVVNLYVEKSDVEVIETRALTAKG